MPNPPRIIYQGPSANAPKPHHHGRGFGGITKDTKGQRAKIDRPDDNAPDHADMANQAPSIQLNPDGSSPQQAQAQQTQSDLQQFAQNPWGGGGMGPPMPYDGADAYPDEISDDHDVIDADVIDGSDVDGGDALQGLAEAVEFQYADAERPRWQSYARGRLGFMVPFGQIAGAVQVLSLEVPPTQAREWTIVLIAARSFTGIGAALGTPDNNATTLIPAQQFVRLEWGTDGALERTELDYPVQGTSITVSASSIRLSLVNTGTVAGPNLPIVGGFIVPAGKRFGSDNDPPTRTILIQAGAGPGNTPGIAPMPARASAYRLMFSATDAAIGVGSNASPMSVQQTDISGATIFSNDGYQPTTGVSLFGPQPLTNLTVAKIHPQAQAIRVANTGAGNPAINVFVNFDLDMG